jgi:hypothetical protein
VRECGAEEIQPVATPEKGCMSKGLQQYSFQELDTVHCLGYV